MRRKGRSYLVLILPDGSKSMIPADWTDGAAPADSRSVVDNVVTLGSLEDLLHTRAVVDALLSRLASRKSENRKSPARKESAIARKKSKPLRSSPRRNLPLGNAARRTQDSRDRNSGTSHR